MAQQNNDIESGLARALECIAFCSVAFAAACSSANASSIRQLEDGRYQLECDASLRECLARAEAACGTSGYQVARAAETKRRVGVPPVESEYIASRAVFECGPREATQGAPPAAGTSPAATALPTAQTCFPGASQACVGPGGCAGGQSCLPDGKALSPCDCGPPKANQ